MNLQSQIRDITSEVVKETEDYIQSKVKSILQIHYPCRYIQEMTPFELFEFMKLYGLEAEVNTETFEIREGIRHDIVSMTMTTTVKVFRKEELK